MDFLEWLMTIWDVASFQVIEDSFLGLPGPPTAGLITLVVKVFTLLGYCAMLSINHVKGIRFLATLMVGGVFLTLLYAIQALILQAVAGPFTQHGMYLTDLLAVTLPSTAPLVCGFLVFIPHLGLLISRILQGWSTICLWFLVTTAMETSWWQALIATGLAWGIMQLTSRLLRCSIRYLTGRVRTLVTGRPAILDPRDALAGASFIPVEAKAIP